MRTIESIKENEVVNATTEQDAIAFCKLLHESGKTWCDGDNYTNHEWHHCKHETCYYVHEGSFMSLELSIKDSFTITDAKEFIAPTGEAGEAFDCATLEKLLNQLTVDKNGFIRNKSRVIDQIHSLHLRTLQRK